jgi:hypothetical protein
MACPETTLTPPRQPTAPLPGLPGEIITATGISVKINRRAYSPALRHGSLPADTIVPWWDGRQLRFQFA